MEAIQAFKSQFFDPNSKEPESPISAKNFFDVIKAKMAVFGRDAGYNFAEGFNTERSIGVNDIFDLK